MRSNSSHRERNIHFAEFNAKQRANLADDDMQRSARNEAVNNRVGQVFNHEADVQEGEYELNDARYESETHADPQFGLGRIVRYEARCVDAVATGGDRVHAMMNHRRRRQIVVLVVGRGVNDVMRATAAMIAAARVMRIQFAGIFLDSRKDHERDDGVGAVRQVLGGAEQQIDNDGKKGYVEAIDCRQAAHQRERHALRNMNDADLCFFFRSK